MTAGDFLAALPSDALVAALVLCRVSAAVMLLPGLGEQEIPMTLRAATAFSLSCFVMPVVMTHFQGVGIDSSVPPFVLARLVSGEFLSGLLLGLLARLMSLSLPVATQIISTFVGLSSVLQPDPDMGAQTTALSRLGALAVPVLMLGTGLYQIPLMALVRSYDVFAPGHILPAGDMAHVISLTISASFKFSVELAGPFIALGTLWQALLAILSRFVPTMQAYSLAMPGQLLGGLMMFAVLSGSMIASWMADMTHVLRLLPGF